MSPSSNRIAETIVVVVALGYLLTLDCSEARGLEEQKQDEALNYNQGNQAQQMQNLARAQIPMLDSDNSQNLDRLDSDDDDDDDDRYQQAQPDGRQQLSNGPAQMAAGSELYQADQGVYQSPYPAQDLKPAASKHHGHKHGAKGWLDMGAWTGKKGAFGWYDKHPVGKGKR